MCGTRQTLLKTAYEAGLDSQSLYLSYILKCRPVRKYHKELCRSICIKYLWEQIEAINPAIVVCLGNIACQSFFGDPEAEVKRLRGQLRTVRDYRTIVSYHPLAVRRRPTLSRIFLEDWELVVSTLVGIYYLLNFRI